MIITDVQDCLARGASQRKIQNRVAQREFRQRKLQYVKDLEARVEFLSGSRDTQLEALKAMLRGKLFVGCTPVSQVVSHRYDVRRRTRRE